MNNIPPWCLYKDHPEPVSFIQGFFSQQECESMIGICKTFPLEDGLIGAKSLSNNRIRDSKIAFVPPTAEMEPFYAKLTDGVFFLNDRNWNFDLFSFNEHLQFTQYSAPGGKYDSHVDTSFGRSIRKLSIVVQLSDENEYEGGDLQAFFNIERPISLPRTRGTLIAFPSYVLHQVTPVSKGTRNSLVGWITGNPFK